MQHLKNSSNYLVLVACALSFSLTDALCMQSFAQKNLKQLQQIQSKQKNISPIITLDLPNQTKTTKQLPIESDFFLTNLDEEYFELPIQDDDDSFDLKELLTDLIVKNSDKYDDITTIKNLFNPENLDEECTIENSSIEIETINQAVDNDLLKKLVNKQDNSIYEDAIYNCTLEELATIFPMCYEQKNNSYIEHFDCCIRDLRLFASRGVDPTIKPIDIFTTHGTWGQNNTHLELENFKKLALSISSSHKRPVRLFSIKWSGQDSKDARKRAATTLANIIKQLNFYYIGFIGFSHGVNVFNITSTLLPKFTALFSFCVARPNLETICNEQQSKCIPIVIDTISEYDMVIPISQWWEGFKTWIWGKCCEEGIDDISLITSRLTLRLDQVRPSHVMTASVIPHIPNILKEMVINYNHIDALKSLSLTIIPENKAQEHEVNPINLTLEKSLLDLPDEVKEHHKKTKEEYSKVYKLDVRTPDSIWYATYCRMYNFLESVNPRR